MTPVRASDLNQASFVKGQSKLFRLVHYTLFYVPSHAMPTDEHERPISWDSHETSNTK